MSKTSKQVAIIVSAALLLIAAQVVLAGLFLSRKTQRSRNQRTQATPPQRNGNRQSRPQPVFTEDFNQAPRPPRSKAVPKPALPKPKPTGPRAAPPEFSTPGGIYTNLFSVVLKTAAADAVIRYTLNGFEPDEACPAYAEPIPISQTTVLRARAYQKDLAPADGG